MHGESILGRTTIMYGQPMLPNWSRWITGIIGIDYSTATRWYMRWTTVLVATRRCCEDGKWAALRKLQPWIRSQKYNLVGNFTLTKGLVSYLGLFGTPDFHRARCWVRKLHAQRLPHRAEPEGPWSSGKSGCRLQITWRAQKDVEAVMLIGPNQIHKHFLVNELVHNHHNLAGPNC